jgi:branched-subunit amino acid transport protein
MTVWMVVVAVGLGSYVLRTLPLLAGRRWLGSMRVEGAVAHAGTAALAALVVGGLRGASATPGPAVAVLAAAGIALVVARRRASLLRVLAAGFGTYFVVLAIAAVRL